MQYLHDSLFIAERVATVEEKEKDIEHFKKYFNVFFSKLALFLKNRNEKITLKVKKRKLYFVCCSGRMTANYKKINRRQNINRKRRNKTNGGMNPTDISTKERRKSVWNEPSTSHIYDLLRSYRDYIEVLIFRFSELKDKGVVRVYPLDNLTPTGDVSVTKFSKFKIVSTNFTLGPTSLHLRLGVRLYCYYNSTVILLRETQRKESWRLHQGLLLAHSLLRFVRAFHTDILTTLVPYFIIPCLAIWIFG